MKTSILKKLNDLVENCRDLRGRDGEYLNVSVQEIIDQHKEEESIRQWEKHPDRMGQ